MGIQYSTPALTASQFRFRLTWASSAVSELLIQNLKVAGEYCKPGASGERAS